MIRVVWRELPGPGSGMGEEEQEPPQIPSPFHCFSLPRASNWEGNPTCGSQGNLRFIPGLHSVQI